MDFLYWRLDLHQQAQTLLIHIIALDGFSPFHSSFMVIDGLMEPGHVKARDVQLEKKGFMKGRGEINE